MLREVQSHIKGSELKGLKHSVVLTLCVLFLVSSVYASTDCIVGKVTTCGCPDGSTERYANYERFKEARADPDSCCYYNPQSAVRIDPTSLGVDLEIKVLDRQVIQTETQQIPDLSVKIIEPPVNTVQLETTQMKYRNIFLRDIRALFLSVFQLPLPMRSQISNHLSS